LAWTINYTETARKQLRKLDKQIARRILVIEIGNRKEIYR
jgi:mRNA-degrading endonuclease RelE of RelBE toxin-antitoxin system